MRGLLYMTFLFSSFLLFTQCSKENCKCIPPPNAQSLTYGDSIFFLKYIAYIINPLSGRTGTYTAFPDYLQMDKTTGKITVTTRGNDGESQTGLWYKITYKSPDGKDVDSTLILLSGITYVDKFYRLSQNDSIIYPIYNGNTGNLIPSGNYDLGQDNGLDTNPANGQINIKESIRKGLFRSQLHTGWEVAKIKYAIDDNSKGAANEIDIIIYYYSTMASVPSNVSTLIQAHQKMIIGLCTPVIPSTFGEIGNNIPGNLFFLNPDLLVLSL